MGFNCKDQRIVTDSCRGCVRGARCCGHKAQDKKPPDAVDEGVVTREDVTVLDYAVSVRGENEAS